MVDHKWIAGFGCLLFCGNIFAGEADKQPKTISVRGQKVIRGSESREDWSEAGRRAIEASKKIPSFESRAKNVILFIGDGMGVSTVTAARILEGQLKGNSGEENLLSFESFPHVALLKTYSANQQVADSAPTMTAMVTGVKTKDGVLALDQDAIRNDPTSASGNQLKTILEQAEERGMSTGIVTTARVTHATPAACYAHSPNRDWEVDSLLNEKAKKIGFPDIATQLIEFPFGDGPEVIFGGGRRFFLPRNMQDPEDPALFGARADGRDLTAEWIGKNENSKYVYNNVQFDAIEVKKIDHVLGLFDPSHMEYEIDRALDKSGEPSLTQMTVKAIEILSRNPKGFFLMVEGGRIDHAHHMGNAYRALTETIEFSNAVRAALRMIDHETLVLVTADHSHALNIVGYSVRGNDILGKVIQNDERGEASSDFTRDVTGRPFTALVYANGPGNVANRTDLTEINTAAPDYIQESAVPLVDATHSGEDVPVYATGNGSYLIHGVQEQNYVYYAIAEALGF